MKQTEIEKFFKGNTNIPLYDQLTANKARHRQNQLTKPIGSLGKLEDLAIWMAGWQKKLKPTMKNPYCLVFAGNHGISNRGVSAYPSEVTYQMVENFKKGGAAINQLCDLANIKLSVIPINLDKPTRDFSKGIAMKKKEVFSAMQLGFNSVPSYCDLLVLGEMGISNTSSATAISCALFNEPVKLMTGIGTGLNKNQLSKKIEIIKSALKLHGKNFKDPISILSCYGGREIAAIAGSVISARLKSIPVLLDGFICTAAASSLILFDKMILDHCRISHLSSEQGHAIVLRKLKMEPILDLKLRLGEGSGAATASLILKAALATHNGMSTFTDAKVTQKIV
mgnify:FL=1